MIDDDVREKWISSKRERVQVTKIGLEFECMIFKDFPAQIIVTLKDFDFFS